MYQAITLTKHIFIIHTSGDTSTRATGQAVAPEGQIADCSSARFLLQSRGIFELQKVVPAMTDGMSDGQRHRINCLS
jgi:hypothetical protein